LIRSGRRAVVSVAKEMKARAFVTGTTGNVSARTRRGMLITPTRRAYETLRPRDLLHTTLDGDTGRRGTKPSLEWPIHAAIYRERPDVNAVVHTHSPWATARGFQPEALEVRTEERTYYGLESVPVVPPHPAGSAALAAAITLELMGADLVLLAEHGVIAVGRSPGAALELCALAEYLAQVDLLARVRSELPAAMPDLRR